MQTAALILLRCRLIEAVMKKMPLSLGPLLADMPQLLPMVGQAACRRRRRTACARGSNRPRKGGSEQGRRDARRWMHGAAGVCTVATVLYDVTCPVPQVATTATQQDWAVHRVSAVPIVAGSMGLVLSCNIRAAQPTTDSRTHPPCLQLRGGTPTCTNAVVRCGNSVCRHALALSL